MQLSFRGRQLIPRSRWRRAALAFATAAFFTFIVNLSFIIWATVQQSEVIEKNIDTSIGTIIEGGRSYIKAWNTGLHVVINIISTILLAGSNYCMQCLVAPTRAEINNAHQRKKWLDIGIPSVRNILSITWKKKLLWLLLSLSSLPLHLLFNSMIFASISTNLYTVCIVDTQFLEAEDVNSMSLPNIERQKSFQHFHEAFKNKTLQHRNLVECLGDYGTTFQALRGDLLLVVSNKTILTNNTYPQRIFTGGAVNRSIDWMCERNDYYQRSYIPCDEMISDIKNQPGSPWKPFGFTIQDCYSQETREHSKLLFSSTIGWIVTILNLLKAVLMLFVAYGGSGRPILTVGDALASFLQEPEEYTKGMCLNSKKDFSKNTWNETPRQFDPTSRRKFTAGSLGRWAAFVVLYLLALGVSLFLLTWSLAIINTGDNTPITKYGLGVVHSDTIIGNRELLGDIADSLIFNAIFANTPQVIMSLIYFNYNALFTGISLITEWDRFGKERKGLRVSTEPEGAQRETYFLQLPYRYSLPLIVFSGLLHWFISQSIFLVNIEAYDSNDTKNTAESITACGFSPVGIICVIVASVVMVGFLVASGWRRLRCGGIPVAASCSAAISAACHPIPVEPNAWKEEVRWGVTPEPDVEPRHCSFSSGRVDSPVKGELYE